MGVRTVLDDDKLPADREHGVASDGVDRVKRESFSKHLQLMFRVRSDGSVENAPNS